MTFQHHWGFNSTGGSLAAPVWGYYMFDALKKVPVKSYDFENAELKQIEICENNGALADSTCHNRISEYFLPGTNPNTASSNETYNNSLFHNEEKTENNANESKILNDEDLNL